MSRTIPGMVLAVAMATAPVAYAQAQEHAHGEDAQHAHQSHGAQGAELHSLQLNDGSQWETDAPLRKAMARLRQDIHPLMPNIHQDELSEERYDALAVSVNDQVAYMIEHCELEGEADAQLHLVIADLMTGADVMQGKTTGQARRNGAIRVVGALNNYATYFNDPEFEKLGH